MEEVAEFLLNSSGKGVILCHQNADLDCVCSAVALMQGLRKLNPNLEFEIGTAECYSKASKKVLEAFKIDAFVDPKLDSEILLILDTSSIKLLHPLGDDVQRFKGNILLIDHHRTDESLTRLASAALLDDSASSTSEVVYELLLGMGAEIKGVIAQALMVGIYADTEHLKYATPRAIRIIGDMLERSDLDYDGVLSLLSSAEDFSEKLAHLKAAQRLEIHRYGDYLLVTSEVSSFISSAANALVNVGSDCVFVGSQKKDMTQVSARASASFTRSTGVDLGIIMGKIGELVNGSGGGHRGAAAAKGRGDLKKALDECITLVQDYLRTKGNTVNSNAG
ncbi:MAG: DHH family phosphoesterase [Candidatus Hydrothermarchaeota archaeon]|jgi:nanoRNase/pAp phosphatase (c-di-AMP/oligoRNAs hydrolase)|nr:DHH family phosphoesterase [Candidatus Hydrothermarchaeota archaeon]